MLQFRTAFLKDFGEEEILINSEIDRERKRQREREGKIMDRKLELEIEKKRGETERKKDSGRDSVKLCRNPKC